MSQIKLAFAGLMRSGKDTAANYMVEKYGATNMKFADPLYDILHYAQDRCGLAKVKDRKFLQWIGTEWGRETINQNIWVDQLFKDAARISTPIVVSDARFTNEFRSLQAAGFKVVKIDRDPVARLGHEPNATEEAQAHASEKDVHTYTLFDAVVWNDGTIEDLHKKVDQLTFKFFPVEAGEYHMDGPAKAKHNAEKEMAEKMILSEIGFLSELKAKMNPSQMIEIGSIQSRIKNLEDELTQLA